MKKILFSIVLPVVISVTAFAGKAAVAVPEVGTARLHVVGWNVENYLLDVTASNASANSEYALQQKTQKMVNAFRTLDADIIALCEVERNDSILGYLTAALNADYGRNVFAYIRDGIAAASQNGNGYMPIKSGFVYRKDKVTPLDESTSPYAYGEYEARMRIQLFKELSTGEKFVLSVNHFKAKSGSDEGESQRQTNATHLINKLNLNNGDPDILIMGDLNAYMGETPIVMLQNAGYGEQLIRYDANAYTYIYKGKYGLLDHAMANSTMADQISGAGVYHLCTGGSSAVSFSDHDGYLIGLNLGYHPGENPDTTSIHDDDCQDFSYEVNFCDSFGAFVSTTYEGEIEWNNNAVYGAGCNAYNRDKEQHATLSANLGNLSNYKDATITINHQIYYNNGDENDCDEQNRLYIVSDNVTDSVKLTISNYPFRRYEDVTIKIPDSYLGGNTRIIFDYYCPNPSDANYWEIKSFKMEAICKPMTSADVIHADTVEPAARKYLYRGKIFIMRDGNVYDIVGRLIE